MAILSPQTRDAIVHKDYRVGAGIKARSPYQCRHTTASRLLTAGEPIFYVKPTLGHATIEQTQKAYARWIASKDDGKRYAEVWEKRLVEAEAAFDAETALLDADDGSGKKRPVRDRTVAVLELDM